MKLTKCALDEIPFEIYAVLDDIGIPAHLKGYIYIAYSLKILVEDPTKTAVTKVIYPAVAKAFGSSSSKVERAIRHAVDRLIVDSSESILRKYFGNAIDYDHEFQMTNGQFLITLARVIRRQILEISDEDFK